MSKLSVLMCTDFWFPKIGGMERSLDNLCACFPPEITPILFTAQAAPAGFVEADYGPSRVVRCEPDPAQGYYPHVLAALRQISGPKVVHVFGFSYHWPTAQAGFLRQIGQAGDVGLVLKVPTSGDAARYLTGSHRQAVGAIDRYIALTDDLAAELVACGVHRERIAQIPNGVRTDHYVPCTHSRRSRLRADFGLPEDRFLVGFCGRFERRKRIDLLVEALALLPVAHRPCLVLAGYADPTFGMGVDVTEWLGPDVVLLQVQPDPRAYYGALDAYVSASEAEGMSNALLEAMAAGLPVVATAIPGHRELIEPGLTGLTFAPGDANALAACLAVLSNHHASGVLQRWGEAARERVISRYDQAVISKRYAALYGDLVREHRSPGKRSRRTSVEVADGDGTLPADSVPFRLTFETNPDSCNLHCPMCAGHSHLRESGGGRPEPRQMSVSLLQDVFAELRGTGFREAVSTSMGEPLLYPHFDAFIQLCARDGVLLHVTTNGTFPCGGVRYWGKRLLSIGADIKVSLNGASAATQERIMAGCRWDDVIGNLHALSELRDEFVGAGGARSRLTIRVTFMEDSIGELPAIVRLAHELGFDRVRGSHVVALFPAMREQPLTRSAGSRERFATQIQAAIRTAEELADRTGRRIELSNFGIWDEDAPPSSCPYAGLEAWIQPHGQLLPCCVPEPIRPVVQLGNVGSAGVLAVWRGAAYRSFCRTYDRLAECRACTKRRAVAARGEP